MALDTYKKEKTKLEKEDAIEGGIPKAPEDNLTLKQIMNDKEKSSLFGKMLEHEGADPAVMKRLLEGKPLKEDFPIFEEYRAQFSEKMREAEDVEKELTAELVGEMGGLSPEFAVITKSVGSKEAASVIKGQMKEVIVTDPDQFSEIKKHIDILKDFKEGGLKDLDEKIQKQSQENNIDTDEYMRVLAITDKVERDNALNDLVKKKWDKEGFGKLKRGINFVIGQYASKDEAKGLHALKDEIDLTLKELDQYKTNLGYVLSAAIGDNQDLRDAFSREIIGEPKKKEVVGVNDVRSEMEKVGTQEEIDAAWNEELSYRDDWDTLDGTGKDSAREFFSKNYKKEAQNKIRVKGGFWSGIFGSIFNKKFSMDKAKLKS